MVENKKHYRAIIFIFSIITAIFIVVIGICLNNSPKKPFHNLSSDNVNSVVLFYGDYEPYVLTNNEKETFLFLLKGIVIYQKDNSYTGYDGVNARQFYVEFQNGRTVFVAPANPFFIIDNKGYRTEYVPCNELAKFRSDIIENKFTNWSEY